MLNKVAGKKSGLEARSRSGTRFAGDGYKLMTPWGTAYNFDPKE